MIQLENLSATATSGLVLALLAPMSLWAASPALAKQPPRAVRVYTSCVLEYFRHPGAEKSANFDGALDLAKSDCGNLRPAAVDVIQRTMTRNMNSGGDTPESVAQGFLDIAILEQTAGIWAEWHPDEVYHGR